MATSVHVYVDGACSDNGKPNAKAGYGVWFSDNDPRNESGVIVGKQSNNSGELTAFIRALEILETNINNNETINVHIDSEYVIKCASSYGEKLERNNWKTSDDKIPPNVGLVKRARELFKNKINIKLHHVKAHTDKEDIHSKGNAGADRLASLSIGMNPDDRDVKMKENIVKLEWITFQNKDEAKTYGAKWEHNKKYWYIHNSIDEENKRRLLLLKETTKTTTVPSVNLEKKNYIRINYNDKNKAKSLGAKWDPGVKSWYYYQSLSEDKKEDIIKLQTNAV